MQTARSRLAAHRHVCSPGVTKTNFVGRHGEAAEVSLGKLLSSYERDVIPLHRAGSALEVAHAIEFLADSNKAAYIVGADLVVDGGVLAGAPNSVMKQAMQGGDA